MTRYDLVLKGGRVFDPGQELDDRLDVAVSDGRIVAMEPDIDGALATDVVEVGGRDRYVVPGLIDMHTHIAPSIPTPSMEYAYTPDFIGVESGVTTLVDAGSLGLTNLKRVTDRILPQSRTRVLIYIAAGSLTQPIWVNSLEDLDRDAIGEYISAHPGLVSGIKMRMHGRIMYEHGEEMVDLVKAISRDHELPVMVHIGDQEAKDGPDPNRVHELTRYLFTALDVGDIVTHLSTPHVGGVLDDYERPIPELKEAGSRGLVLDSGFGRANFGYQVALRQAQFGIHADTISSDMTANGVRFTSLVECMSCYMALGYSFANVVQMATTNPAKAIGLSKSIGELSVGREADITVIDLHRGDFRFVDMVDIPGTEFRGEHGIAPVLTLRRGEMITPRWGTHPWGWLPRTP